MKRVLITGMSGTGKSTLIEALSARGFKAVDADLDGYSHLVAARPGELTGPGEGVDWVWQEERLTELLSAEDTDFLFVSGCAPNQGKFYGWFDHVVLLTAPEAVIEQRLRTRTNNPFGKEPGQLERTLELKRTLEPALRQRASLEIETSIPLDEVVDALLSNVAPEHGT